MPTSSTKGKDKIISWVSHLEGINKILDIGCGAGTYPILFKEKTGILQNSKWWGVEAWEPYIKEFSLVTMYDTLINQDARLLNWSELPNFDLIFCGDVLEHMTKEESQTLINTCLKKTRFLIISIPIKRHPQGEVNGNPFERHIKEDWSHFEVLSSFPCIKDSSTHNKIGVYLLDSSLPESQSSVL